MPNVMWVDCKGRSRQNAHCNVDDTPNLTLSVFFKHGPYLRRIGQVALMRIDHCAVLFFGGRVFRKGGFRDPIETTESGRKRVVVVIDRNDLVFACLLKSKDDVRALWDGQWSIGEARDNANRCSQRRL